MTKNKKGYPFLIICGAVILLALLSIVPWGDLTGNILKDYNLVSDISHNKLKITAEETLDPELLKAVKESSDTLDWLKKLVNITPVDSLNEDMPPKYSAENPREKINNIDESNEVVIEDYTFNTRGLKNFNRALTRKDSQPVRIAVIGDSYIEGDILTMDIRHMLQEQLGGRGVGYMPASSALTGFRTTVSQSCSGWTEHEIRKNARDDMKILQGEYYTSNGASKTTYRGVNRYDFLDGWDKTTVLALARNGGSITLSTDSITQTFALEPSDTIASVSIDYPTASATLKASSGVEIAGVYLDGNSGILVDNMSLRGNSGQTHRKLSVERAQQMRKYVDYDLIIVEYGINALSSTQTNYTAYRDLMIQTLVCLQECYPNADIIMLGIGDRGQKIGGVIQSVPTAPNMVEAQRDAARMSGVLFWDTRQAMGGDGAALTWRQNGLINPDYIHLNHKGGKELATLFVNALNKEIKTAQN